MGIKRKIQKDIRQRKIEVVFTNERLITPSGLSCELENLGNLNENWQSSVLR